MLTSHRGNLPRGYQSFQDSDGQSSRVKDLQNLRVSNGEGSHGEAGCPGQGVELSYKQTPWVNLTNGEVSACKGEKE
jgi:hypothetical protein